MGGATSIDITKEGVDKGYGLKRLCVASRIPLEEIIFIHIVGYSEPGKYVWLTCTPLEELTSGWPVSMVAFEMSGATRRESNMFPRI